jgi:hypothetical protein
MNLRDHLPHRHHDEPTEEAAPPVAAGDEPIPGYDKLSVHDLMLEFHHHTQAELDACEEYERSHQNRTAVLNKLRYMHTRQPWQGYDEMDEDEILARLENAEDTTIKQVRDYEHKFGNRPRVVEAAMRLHHERLASKPPEKPPAYQPGGGSHDKLR